MSALEVTGLHPRSGVAAATIAPFFMAVGFFIWDSQWKGSAFCLNLFKCSVASSMFLVIAVVAWWADSQPREFSSAEQTTTEVQWILLSSLLGIFLGDNLWLLALRKLGAEKTIVVDSFKPFLAAVFAWALLDEPLSWAVGAGVVVSSVGVYFVCKAAASAEKEASNDSSSRPSDKAKASAASEQSLGYVCAAGNVALDAYGSVLTKQFGTCVHALSMLCLCSVYALSMLCLCSVYALSMLCLCSVCPSVRLSE
jgi:drug/metabolite transporter (DMT)-like permease